MAGCDDDASGATSDLLGASPAFDPAELELARARAEMALFGSATPPSLGRYQLDKVIGGGGMGIVYSAFDPQLHRRVALKVLHPQRNQDTRAQQRMVREAQALARLDHPNVVKVYDAMVEHGRFVLVMELLEGEPLDRWHERAEHHWRDVAALYAQVAEGLEAAHALGIVHRDVKPSNAMLGKDGRVRVVDFGLAYLVGAAEDQAPNEVSARSTQSTLGGVLGTLAYASPEQLRGEETTAASDQFSLCVALHRALEGIEPFSGGDSQSRLASITREVRQYAADRRQIPPWLRAITERGLAADPQRRFPAMGDVVRELRRARGWRRWRLPLLATISLTCTVAGTAAIASRPTDTCDGGRPRVQAVWNDRVRDQISSSVARSATPYAANVHDQLIGTFDRYTSDWAQAHNAVCRAHQRGETSARLLDRQMTCLASRLTALQAAAGVLASTDAASLPQVMNVAAAMPSPLPCLDLELMENETAPPDSAIVRGLLYAARARISAAEALARAGRVEPALDMLREARALAHRTPFPPLQVEVALAEGRIFLAQRNFSRALVSLAEARRAAFEARLFSAAVEASARIIYVEGSQRPQLDRLQGELETLLPLSAGLRSDPLVRPLLLNNVGTVYLAAGRRADAVRYFELAKAETRRHEAPDLELINIDLNLAMLTSDTPAREALAQSVWSRFRDSFGEQHLETLNALTSYGLYTAEPAAAFGRLRSVTASYERYHPAARDQLAMALARSAFLAVELGDSRAAELYERSLSVTSVSDPDVLQRQQLARGELALHQRRVTDAVAALMPIYQRQLSSANWWDRADALRAAIGLGAAATLAGDLENAVRYLEVAIRGLPAIIAINEEVEPKRYQARAQRALAQTLTRLKRAPARAQRLEADARAFYHLAGYPAVEDPKVTCVRNGSGGRDTTEKPCAGFFP